MVLVPHNKPLITADDRRAVSATLSSGWIAQGKQVAQLEADFVGRFGGGGAAAVSSGTSALFLALKAIGLKENARVAIPTYTCTALLNAIYMARAVPCLVDVNPETFCIDPASIATKSQKPDCVIAVHTFGATADIQELKQDDRRIIEDCCQALGGENEYGLLGSQGDLAVFSFYATKIVTGGQGGLIWAADKKHAIKIKDYREFDCRENYKERFNLQMTDIQAALINSQMSRLNEIRAKRQFITQKYLSALPDGLSIQHGQYKKGRMPQRFVVIAPNENTRDALRKHMAARGIECSIPIKRDELLHRYLKLKKNAFPVAERLVATTLSLPIHLSLTKKQITYVATAIREFKP